MFLVNHDQKTYNLADQMFAWEAGELDENEEVAMFSRLIETGTIKHLQGCYGRRAATLVRAGLVSPYDLDEE